jgi:predicted esterase
MTNLSRQHHYPPGSSQFFGAACSMVCLVTLFLATPAVALAASEVEQPGGFAAESPPTPDDLRRRAALDDAFRQLALYAPEVGSDRSLSEGSGDTVAEPVFEGLGFPKETDAPEEAFDEPPRSEDGRYDLRPGWWRVPLRDTDSYFDLYAPEGWRPTLDDTEPGMPVVVFLHGAGATTSVYHPFLREAAESAGVMLALVRSQSSRGWGFPGDAQSLFDTISELETRASIDRTRIAIAGHSAGGAYAYLTAYLSPLEFSAVFTIAAPYQPVQSLRESQDGYVPPIRMYYGVEDRNFTNGSFEKLALQWFELGVEAEYDLQPGYGHNTWPESTIYDGFDFLVSHQRLLAGTPALCQESSERLCLHDGRFAVTVEWLDHEQRSGTGQALPDLKTEESGIFWFFTESNWELLVKVIDACSFNGRFWVISAATTDVGYRMTVQDLVGDQVAIYENDVGVRAPALLDLATLSGCPESSN